MNLSVKKKINGQYAVRVADPEGDGLAVSVDFTTAQSALDCLHTIYPNEPVQVDIQPPVIAMMEAERPSSHFLDFLNSLFSHKN